MHAVRAIAIALAVSVIPVADAHATLIDLGNGLVYDSVQDLTWLKDTGLAGPSGTQETLDDAQAWADALVFAGFSDWRLPRYFGASGRIEDSSEIAKLLEPLGWVWDPQALEYDWQMPRGTGPFVNFNQNVINTFWLGNGNNLVWHSMLVIDPVDDTARTWVVRNGRSADASVPEPATLLLLGAGIAGAVATRRSRRRHVGRAPSQG